MVVPNAPSSIWERVLVADDGAMTPEAACYILRLDFAPTDHTRMEYLNAGANEGTLTPEERDELDEYIRVGHHLALLQSKARLALRNLAVGNGRA